MEASTILAYATGRLEAADQPSIEQHIDRCPSCRRLLAAAAHLEQTCREDPLVSQASAPKQVGRYVLRELIGTGAMGRVYRAHDPDLDREVAIKLLHAFTLIGRQPSRREQRLLRESRVLARLNAPHVIAVHDVGHHEGDLFLAMEYVRGLTLDRWLDAEPRRRDEILSVFQQAARGLAAAHDAGIIHRDFKPTNVLVGDDGRVRVGDFGLARLYALEEFGLQSGPIRDSEHGVSLESTEGAGAILTKSGSLVGTPAYMSPEQHAGAALDARSDQFAFCVALFEALYGRRPFAGGNRRQLIEEITAGRIVAASSPLSIPRWLNELIVRGLSYEPTERWPSMKMIADELRRRDRTRARAYRWMAAPVGSIAAVAAVWLWTNLDAKADLYCDPPQLESIWNTRAEQSIRTAIATAGSDDSAEIITSSLERYARLWSATHQAVCGTRGELEPLHLRERACVMDARQRLQAAIEVLATVDTSSLDEAPRLVLELPDVERCVDASDGALDPPLADRGEATRVERIRLEIAKLKSLGRLGRYEDGLRASEGVLEQARATGYAPVEIAVQLERAWLLEDMGEIDRAIEIFTQTYERSVRDAYARGAASAALGLTWLLHDTPGADQWETWARQWVAQSDSWSQKVILAQTSARRAASRGALDEALIEIQAARQLVADNRGPQSPMLPPLYDLELGILIGLERPLEAIDAGWAAFELTRRAYGEAHPQSIRFLVNVGAALGSAGLYDESIDVFERALALRKRRGLPANADALELWRNLASSYSNAQDPERAIETIDRALRLPVPRHQAASTRGQLIALLTEIHVGLGNPQFAQRRFDEELVRLGDDPGSKRELASSLLAAAEKYRLLGRHDEAYTLERLGLSAMPSAAVPSGPPPQPALDPPQSGHS